MRGKRRKPTPEERCSYRYPDGRQCASWRVQAQLTCASHTPEYVQRMKKQRPFMAQNQNNYKNGLRAAPLKPLRQQTDLQDHLTVKHFEIFLAAESAAEEADVQELSRLSPELI